MKCRYIWCGKGQGAAGDLCGMNSPGGNAQSPRINLSHFTLAGLWMFSKRLLESDVGGSRCGEHFLSTCSLNAKFDSLCYQNRNQGESKTKLPLSCRNFTRLFGSQRLPVQLKSTSSSNSRPIRGGAMFVSMIATAA